MQSWLLCTAWMLQSYLADCDVFVLEREPRRRLAAALTRFLLRLVTDQPTKAVDIVNLCCMALSLQIDVLRFSRSLSICILARLSTGILNNRTQTLTHERLGSPI